VDKGTLVLKQLVFVSLDFFVEEGVALGRRPELVGGGLVRSLGDWFQVVSMRRKGATISSDARILGGSDFVDQILSEAKEQEKETLRFASGRCDLPTLLARIAKEEGVAASGIRTGIRKRTVVRARKLISVRRRCAGSGMRVRRLPAISIFQPLQLTVGSARRSCQISSAI